MDAAVAEKEAPTATAPAAPMPEAAPAATTPETPPAQDTLLTGGPVTPTAPAADGKDGSDAPKDGAQTVEFDLKAPEGVTLDPAHVEGIRTLATEHGLTPKAAQALLDRDFAAIRSITQAREQQWAERVSGWRSEVEKHPTLGGANFARTVADARRALSLAPPELHAELSRTGFGNHPGLVAWAAAIGAKMGEAELVTGDQSATKVRSPADDFPNTPKELGGSKKD